MVLVQLRFVSCFHSLKDSASFEVKFLIRFLARDIKCVTGRNLNLIQETAKVNPWITSRRRVKEALILAEVVEVPELDRWRLRYLISLLQQRRLASDCNLESEEAVLDNLIASLVRD